ncbi:MAG: Thioredoxin-disulfide reductase [Nocardioidaceae bacterium]|jgi:thioredoxin reductase (NADPH)|nr:Thioredoxin-disulfide reductase [Nocardioidaceae bacterium]
MPPHPVIAVVMDQPETRSALGADLRRRYGADYTILELGSDNVVPVLSDVHSLAVVISTVELAGRVMGVEVLGGVRRAHPDARRVLLVDRGQWASHPVRRAMVLGQVEGYLFVPWMPREQWLHLPMAEYLADWSRTQRPEIVAVTVVGRRWDDRSHALRDMLSRASVPFAFHDADSEPGRAAIADMRLDSSVLPVVRFHTGEVAVDPSDITISELLGFRATRPGLLCDVAIIGAGPAGLSAAVYAASEGLSTVIIDPSVPGGQAGTSSRIRNYLGFPRGLSGSELTNRATEQAWLFGAEFVLARRAERLHRSEVGYVVSLSDSTDVTARAVVLATGVEWRRLGVPSVEALLGVGVYYGAAGAEADALEGEPVFVVGGGNSAGQAAVHLARHAESVTILIRSQSLAASMSDYLIGQLEAVENIHVRAMTEVVGASGQTRLQRLTLRQRRTGTEEEVAATALFVMTGGQPHTDWLPEEVQRDSHGYVLTGDDVSSATLARAPLFLETSLYGVFAVGDVRHGATRRVAPSVGYGAIAISLVHQFLAEHD